jgi:hypothetical protein
LAEADRPTQADIEALSERVKQLEKINEALIDRVERSSDVQGGAFSMFEAAIALESMVRDRTAALENALSSLNEANADMAAAHRDADAARVRLRDAIESLPDGFALFDADDRLLLHNEAYLEFWPALRGGICPCARLAKLRKWRRRAGCRSVHWGRRSDGWPTACRNMPRPTACIFRHWPMGAGSRSMN